MLSRLKTRPSPALVISLIALFVSLGGAGYAAVTVTGKNVKNGSLTGKDVKNSSLTGTDVKNSSLTGKDLKNGALAGVDIKGDSLSGNQILETQLGKVPSATTADLAGRAGSAASVDKLETVGSYKKVVSSASNDDSNLARDAATEVPLYSAGPFDVYGKCFTDADSPATFAEVYVRTSQNESILNSNFDSLLGTVAFLNMGTDETQRQVVTIAAGANTVDVFPGYSDDFFAAAPSGASISGSVSTWAKNGTLAGGNGIYGAGNVCLFGGYGIS